MTPLRTSPVLLLALVILLLAAGCESESPPASAPADPAVATLPTKVPVRHVTTTIPPVVTTETESSETATASETPPVPAATATPPVNYHPEYIRMDSTVYSAGEVVEFYLVNRGSEIKGCDYSRPAYTIYQLFPDGTRRKVSGSEPGRSYRVVIYEGEPTSSTGPFTFNTAGLVPGRFLIRFDCGNNVAKEFVIMAHGPTNEIP